MSSTKFVAQYIYGALWRVIILLLVVAET